MRSPRILNSPFPRSPPLAPAAGAHDDILTAPAMKTLLALLVATPILAAPPKETVLQKKLKSIVIPRIEFREATVVEAIEFLKQRAKQLDPDGVGVNIALKTDLNPAPSAPVPAKP